MDISRRVVLATGLSLLAGTASASTRLAHRRRDGLLAFPPPGSPIVDFHRWIDRPVILRSAEMVTLGGTNQFVRVVSTDGVEGVCMGNARLEEVESLFRLAVKPVFMGPDVRDLQGLVQRVYVAQYKFAGLAFWAAVGHLELALWDLLGRTAGKRCVDFMGPVVRERIPIYASSLSRNTTPDAEVAELEEVVARYGARAIKIKVGGRLSYNVDAAPGRSRALVSLARKRFGDDFTIYCDANGSFDAPAAIELTHMLADHGIAMLEEPCPHEDPEMTAQVTRRSKVPIAGGEQDGRLEQWRWYIENKGLDVLQPDFMYNGGMLRTLMVQRMAAKARVGVAPHFPQSGPSHMPLRHFAAFAPNLHGFQEYRAKPLKHDFAYSPVTEPKDGHVSLPGGPGWGVAYDPDLWKRAKPI